MTPPSFISFPPLVCVFPHSICHPPPPTPKKNSMRFSRRHLKCKHSSISLLFLPVNMPPRFRGQPTTTSIPYCKPCKQAQCSVKSEMHLFSHLEMGKLSRLISIMCFFEPEKFFVVKRKVFFGGGAVSLFRCRIRSRNAN